MFPSLSFDAHSDISHQKRVMESPNLRFLRSLKVVFDLQQRINANNGRWKRICQKSVTLCNGITSLTSGPISFNSI